MYSDYADENRFPPGKTGLFGVPVIPEKQVVQEGGSLHHPPDARALLPEREVSSHTLPTIHRRRRRQKRTFKSLCVKVISSRSRSDLTGNSFSLVQCSFQATS